MAQPNKKGTPYLGLNLEVAEEKSLKKYLSDKDITAKQLLRRLVREFLKTI